MTRRFPAITAFTITFMLLLVPVLVAHDDAKEEEAGDPIKGSGHVGGAMLPDDDGEIMGFPAKNVALMSWLTSRDLTGTVQNGNDIWGYVSPSGREYAIVGLQRATAFVEVTDPANPVVVEVIEGAPSSWRDMAVYKHFAYSVNETGGGIQVINMKRIDRGKVKLLRHVHDGGLVTVHNISANEESGYLYLSGSNLNGGALIAVNLDDPKRPRLEPVQYDGPYAHDAQIVSYNKGPNAGREIAFSFSGGVGLEIVDFTDKANPFLVKRIQYPGLAYNHSGYLSHNRRFLYINDELDERDHPDIEETATYIVRVKNVERARFVKKWSNGNTSIDHNSITVGKYLYQANYRSGYRLFDVKKGRNPREVAYFDTYPDDDEPMFSGAWGVFVFPSGTVVISDINRGLFVLA